MTTCPVSISQKREVCQQCAGMIACSLRCPATSPSVTCGWCASAPKGHSHSIRCVKFAMQSACMISGPTRTDKACQPVPQDRRTGTGTGTHTDHMQRAGSNCPRARPRHSHMQGPQEQESKSKAARTLVTHVFKKPGGFGPPCKTPAARLCCWLCGGEYHRSPGWAAPAPMWGGAAPFDWLLSVLRTLIMGKRFSRRSRRGCGPGA